jgi:putative membrane protein
MINKFALAGVAAAMALSVSYAYAADKDSQTFIKNAIEANYAEIDAGKLAQEKGTDPAVKEYGAMMVKDHTDANEKAKQVASLLGVDPPTGSSVGQKASYLKLKVLSGGTFDRSFANTMVSDHKAVIKEFQAEAPKSDPAGAFAKDMLPALQHHLDGAQNLVQQTAQTTGSK